MRYFALLIFFVFLSISGCNNLTESINHQEFYESGIKAEVYFCPINDCDSITKNNVNDAKSSIHCAFWDLDLNDLIRAFGKKSHSADVKIVIDNRNYDNQIKGDGVRIAKSSQ